MRMQHIKKLIKKEEKEKNAVVELLLGVKKAYVDPDLVNAVPIRMSEINAFIQVIHGALESDLHDESFYKQNVGGVMHLLEERFDELQVMVDALLTEHWDNKKKNLQKAAA